MPAPRKPKKVFVQFAIALVVAGLFGLGALMFGINIITNMGNNADAARKNAEKIKAEAQAELERIKAEEARRKQQPPKVSYKIVQAAVDIQPGQPITKEMLTLAESDTTPSATTLSIPSQAVGKTVKSAVLQGDTLDTTNLLNEAGLANLKPGFRAITIQVTNIGSVNNALTAGTRVDVLTTVIKDEKAITKTLLQNVDVIASSNDPAAMGSTPGQTTMPTTTTTTDAAITLAVTPKQAELLTLANQLGKFHLTLRNYSDTQTLKIPSVDLATLMTGLDRSESKKTSTKAPPEPGNSDGFHNVNYSPSGNLPYPSHLTPRNKFTMQIYRGTGTETVDFQQ